MRLSLDALLALDAIAREGSFAKAAEVLHRVPSALTYTMQKLESDLDLLLFDRSGKRAVLTPVGQELLAQGRELLRHADAIERRIKRLGEGWETTVTLAIDGLVPLAWMLQMVAAFDALHTGTRIHLAEEIFGGTWDALVDRRADLAIGAPGDAPGGFGLTSAAWLQFPPFVFAVAPQHPLAQLPEPIDPQVVAQYRAVVVADSSRRILGRSTGYQPAQDTLHVATLQAKMAAQIAGLGAGYLPVHMALPEVEAGRLCVKVVDAVREHSESRIAWRTGEAGRAVIWIKDYLLQMAPQWEQTCL